MHHSNSFVVYKYLLLRRSSSESISIKDIFIGSTRVKMFVPDGAFCDDGSLAPRLEGACCAYTHDCPSPGKRMTLTPMPIGNHFLRKPSFKQYQTIALRRNPFVLDNRKVSKKFLES